MFKNLKRRIKTKLANKTLVRIQIKDVKFTILKLSGKRFTKNYPKNLSWSEDQIKLREDIKNLKYNPIDRKYPSISSDSVCVDGHHRLSSLVKYYPEDYEILVLKSDLKYRYIFWTLIFYVLFFGKDE